MAAPEVSEFSERPPRAQGLQVCGPFFLLDLIGSHIQPALADVKLSGNPGLVLDPIRKPREPMIRVRLPKPIAGCFGKISKLLLT